MRKFWALGIILCSWLLFAFPYWGKGLVPFPSSYLNSYFAPWSATGGMPVKNNAMPDVITQIFPWKRVTIDSYNKGELPLWNPYSFSGTVHMANYQSAVFSPFNVLFVLFPEIHAWSILILLQPLLAGVFMFLFLKSIGRGEYASVFGAISFMFCGFIVVWMAYGTLSYSVLYLPLVLLAISRYSQSGKKIYALLISVSIALSFLSGHFQMSLYVLFYALAFSLFRKRHAFVFLILGILLVAPQVLPAYEAYIQAVRSSLFVKGEVIPWQYVITIFSPDFYGNPVTRNDWFGHYAEWASYVGVIPLAFAVLAIVSKFREKSIWIYLIVGALSLGLAYPTPLLELLYVLKIPVLSTSAASRIIILFSFSFSVLSAFGMDELIRIVEKKQFKRISAWLISLSLFLGILWFSLLVIKPLPPNALSIAVRNTILPTALLLTTIIVGIFLKFIPKNRKQYAIFVFVLLTFFEMYRFASKWMPFDSKSLVYPKIPVISKMRELTLPNAERVFGNIGNEVGSAFGIPLVEGYDAVYQDRYGKFLTIAEDGEIGTSQRSVATLNKHGDYADRVLNILGVRYIMHKKSDGRFGWAYPYWEKPWIQPIWQDEHFEILDNTQSLPRAFLASSYVYQKEDSKIIQTLLSPDFDLNNTIVVEKEPEVKPASGPGTVDITSYKHNSVEFKTESIAPKLLFLSDVYDKGWHVTVDGKAGEILRANFDFRAVSLPAGNHTVKMWYWPKSLMYGIYVAGFATLVLTGYLLIWKRNV